MSVVSLIWNVPLSILSQIIPYACDYMRARLGHFEEEERLVRPLDPPLSNPSKVAISVVIPAFHESSAVLATLWHASSQEEGGGEVEYIAAVVDDETASKVSEGGVAGVRVVRCASGRGNALNAGAAAARGDVVLFLHADCKLPRYWDWEVRAAVCREQPCPAFAFSFAVEGGARAGIGQVAAVANARARGLQLPYGDQALFVTRKRFERIGGFRGDFAMMEDYELVLRMRRACLRASLRTGEDCRVRVLDPPVTCSPRRWQHKGVALTTFLNHAFVIAYAYGLASPNVVYRLYYGRGVAQAPKPGSAPSSAKQNPLRKAGEQSPLRKAGEQSPLRKAGEQSPLRKAGEQSPLRRANWWGAEESQ